jgi:hypothetical protein
MLERYQKNSSISHWNGIKKNKRYIQGTKGLMLTYERWNSHEIVGYSNSNYVGCLYTEKSTSGYIIGICERFISLN